MGAWMSPEGHPPVFEAVTLKLKHDGDGEGIRCWAAGGRTEVSCMEWRVAKTRMDAREWMQDQEPAGS